MAKHSLGSTKALSSDISTRLFVIAISVVPIAALISSGLSSSGGNALSRRTGSGGLVVDVVVDVFASSSLPLRHPAMRMPTTMSVAVRWRMSSHPRFPRDARSADVHIRLISRTLLRSPAPSPKVRR